MNPTKTLNPIISHEIPHSLAEAEGKYQINDYLFILLHRYIEDERYKRIVDSYSGFKILDNSCFELGEAVSNELIAKHVNIIKPDVFVLPDVLGNKRKTLDRSHQFLDEYPALEYKAMAVIQGDTYEDFALCYGEFNNNYNLAMMGIPFCFNWAFKVKMTPFEHAIERVKLVDFLMNEGYIDTNVRHHLLGTWCALEFKLYKNYSWIYSIDTSNPIAAGIEGSHYPIIHKPHLKFDDFAELPLDRINLDIVLQNVTTFKEWTRRT